MWAYNYPKQIPNELCHFGIRGMKWGKRKQNKGAVLTKERKHLSVNDNGMLTISNKSASKKGKINFAVRTGLSVGMMVASMYLATHPQTVEKGQKALKKVFTKIGYRRVSLIPKKVDSGIFSKSLGRMLTVAEALDRGLDLSGD